MKLFVESILGGILITLLALLLFLFTPLLADMVSEDLANVLFSLLNKLIFWPALVIDPINRYYDPFNVKNDPSKDGFLPHSMLAAIVIDVLIYAVAIYFIRRYLIGITEKRNAVLP